MPHARHRVINSQTSALQLSLANFFAEIRSKFVLSLSWFGVVTKMAFGPSETDIRAICCWQLFTAVTTALEQNKKHLSEVCRTITKNLIGFEKCTDTKDIQENILHVTYYVI